MTESTAPAEDSRSALNRVLDILEIPGDVLRTIPSGPYLVDYSAPTGECDRHWFFSDFPEDITYWGRNDGTAAICADLTIVNWGVYCVRNASQGGRFEVRHIYLRRGDSSLVGLDLLLVELIKGRGATLEILDEIAAGGAGLWLQSEVELGRAPWFVRIGQAQYPIYVERGEAMLLDPRRDLYTRSFAVSVFNSSPMAAKLNALESEQRNFALAASNGDLAMRFLETQTCFFRVGGKLFVEQGYRGTLLPASHPAVLKAGPGYLMSEFQLEHLAGGRAANLGDPLRTAFVEVYPEDHAEHLQTAGFSGSSMFIGAAQAGTLRLVFGLVAGEILMGYCHADNVATSKVKGMGILSEYVWSISDLGDVPVADAIRTPTRKGQSSVLVWPRPGS
jgi:hypothetical protein